VAVTYAHNASFVLAFAPSKWTVKNERDENLMYWDEQAYPSEYRLESDTNSDLVSQEVVSIAPPTVEATEKTPEEPSKGKLLTFVFFFFFFFFDSYMLDGFATVTFPTCPLMSLCICRDG